MLADDGLEVDWPDSLVMLLRAVPMARELGVRTELHGEFYEWLIANRSSIAAYVA